jgi:hypothetical protein
LELTLTFNQYLSIMNYRFITILLTSALCFFCHGCEDFIEVDLPQSQLAGKEVFEDVYTANSAMNDLYAKMRDNGVMAGTLNGLSSLLGSYTDELTFFGSNADIEAFYNHSIHAQNNLIKGFWNSSYSQLYAANAILEGLDRSTGINEVEKSRLRGEALFVRAYLHFYLVSLFGEIPYVTTTDYHVNAIVSKQPQAVIWEHIITDLEEARLLLPEVYSGTERIRPIQPVVLALLSRVYLYLGDWSRAEQYATAVIANPLYSLVSNLDLEFLKNSTSTIWAFHPGLAGLNTKDALSFVFASGPPSKPSLSINFANTFELGDLRRNSWIRTVSTGAGVWYHTNKYKEITNTGTSREYTILFRIAEQYLIRAEARAQLELLDGAAADLNMVRNRAGLLGTTASGKEAMLAAILNERKHELFSEQGHRWFDLKRTNQAATVLGEIKPAWDNTHLLFPLPESELLLNGNLLPQNPGY